MRSGGRSIGAALLLAPVFAVCTATNLTPPPAGGWFPSGLRDGVGVASARNGTLPGKLPLQLETILQLAGQRPLELEVARARAAAAAAAVDLADSRWMPVLRPRVTWVRNEGRLQNTAGNLLQVDRQNAFGGAGVGLEVDPARAYFDSLIAAKQRRAAELGVAVVQHFNIEAAVAFYYDLLQATAGLQIAADTARQAEELVKVEAQAAQVGGALRADVLQAKAFLAASKGRVARAQATVAQATARLTGLLALPDRTELVPVETAVEPIDFQTAELPMNRLLTLAIAARPDVAQARSLVDAAAGELARERWSWVIPRLQFGAEYGTFGAAISRGRSREDYFADLSWRIGFGTPARIRGADARHRAAEANMRLRLRNLRTDVEVAVAEVRANKIQMAVAREEIAAATAAVDLVKRRKQAGKALLLEVLAAERSATAARIGLVRAICDQNRAQFRLHRLLGGGDNSPGRRY